MTWNLGIKQLLKGKLHRMGGIEMEVEDLKEQMDRLVDESLLNRVNEKDFSIERIFNYPLLKVAKASDSLFAKLKDPAVIGEHHLLPSEWLNGAKSVVSYFLPFSREICEANRVEEWPAKEWLYGRIEGEEFNNLLRQALVDSVKEAGGEAVAPSLDSRFKRSDLRSNWSERHAAYIAGLGTFSLSKSLITENGCAGRYGSIVTDLLIKSSSRSYSGNEEYCNRCGQCIERCPAGAITEEGKNAQVCYNYLSNVISPRYRPRHGCGKCQTAVACENVIP